MTYPVFSLCDLDRTVFLYEEKQPESSLLHLSRNQDISSEAARGRVGWSRVLRCSAPTDAQPRSSRSSPPPQGDLRNETFNHVSHSPGSREFPLTGER